MTLKLNAVHITNTIPSLFYHCPYCKICRHGRGLGIDSFHCEKCNVCMHTENHSTHVCIENKLFCGCPICGEFMQTSVKPSIFLQCGHAIHLHCVNEYLKVTIYYAWHDTTDELHVPYLHENNH